MKTLAKYHTSIGLGLGPDEVGQKGIKQLHLWRHSQKLWKAKPKIFFFIADSTCPVFWRFEQLSNAFSRGAMDLQNMC